MIIGAGAGVGVRSGACGVGGATRAGDGVRSRACGVGGWKGQTGCRQTQGVLQNRLSPGTTGFGRIFERVVTATRRSQVPQSKLDLPFLTVEVVLSQPKLDLPFLIVKVDLPQSSMKF